jgi:hypothetical protein
MPDLVVEARPEDVLMFFIYGRGSGRTPSGRKHYTYLTTLGKINLYNKEKLPKKYIENNLLEALRGVLGADYLPQYAATPLTLVAAEQSIAKYDRNDSRIFKSQIYTEKMMDALVLPHLASIEKPFYWYDPVNDTFNDDEFVEIEIDVRKQASAGDLESQFLRAPTKLQLLQRKPLLKYFIRLAFQGVFFEVIFKVVMKEELAKLAKIAAGNGRTFLVAPGLFYFLQQVLFRRQEIALKRAGATRVGPFTYGFTTRGGGFDRIIRDHKSLFPALSSGFDEKLKDATEFERHYRVVKRIRKSSIPEEYHFMVDWIYHELRYSKLLFSDGVIVQKVQGNPSGQAMTTTDNCITTLQNVVDSFVTLMETQDSDIELKELLQVWKNHVRLDVLGDDGLLTISRSLWRSGFTFEFIHNLCQQRTIRLIFDDLEGTSPENCSYLSQTFVRDFCGVYLPVPNYAKLYTSLTFMERKWTTEQKISKLVNISNEVAHLDYFDEYRHIWLAVKRVYNTLAAMTNNPVPPLKTPLEVRHSLAGFESVVGGLKTTARMTKKRNVREKVIVKKQTRIRAPNKHEALRGAKIGNDYLASLADPSIRGARIPDAVTTPSSTAHAKVVMSYDANPDSGGTQRLSAVFAPTLRDNRAVMSGEDAGTDWTVFNIGIDTFFDSSIFDAYKDMYVDLRPVSASLEVDYTGTALNAKGSYCIALVSPEQKIFYGSTMDQLFDGTIASASQLAGATVVPAATTTITNWRPIDESAFIYCLTDDVNEMKSSQGFHQNASSFTAYGYQQGVAGIPFWYFVTEDVATDASWNFTVTINFEARSRNNQISGDVPSVQDDLAMQHANNVLPHLPSTIVRSEADEEDHPTEKIQSVAVRDAADLANARGTKQEPVVSSGRNFLSKAASWLGDKATEYLPMLGKAAMEFLPALF